MTKIELIAFQKLKVLIDDAVDNARKLSPASQIPAYEKIREAQFVLNAIFENHILNGGKE